MLDVLLKYLLIKALYRTTACHDNRWQWNRIFLLCFHGAKKSGGTILSYTKNKIQHVLKVNDIIPSKCRSSPHEIYKSPLSGDFGLHPVGEVDCVLSIAALHRRQVPDVADDGPRWHHHVNVGQHAVLAWIPEGVAEFWVILDSDGINCAANFKASLFKLLKGETNNLNCLWLFGQRSRNKLSCCC